MQYSSVFNQYKRRFFSGLEHQGEENVEIPVSAIALSITSGSDIFRELEISHSEQSDDISAPDEHFSKNSSDFWE